MVVAYRAWGIRFIPGVDLPAIAFAAINIPDIKRKEIP
jgi:hypothetical protein